MTKREWEKKFMSALKKLPKNERQKSLEFYREMYTDKKDAGESEESILKEFGNPYACADKILEEYDFDSDKKAKKVKERNGMSIGYIVGMVFFSIIIALPIVCTLIGLLAGFLAAAICGPVVALYGVVHCCIAPLLTGTAVGFLGAEAMGIVCIGIGLLLFVVFFLLTKFTAKAIFKFIKITYKVR